MLFVLLACVPVGDDAVSGDAARADTAAELGVPTWSVAELEAALALALAHARPTPEPVIRAYDALLVHTEAGCPSFEAEGRSGWAGWAGRIGESCTTAEGWSWYGLALANRTCALDGAGTSSVGFSQLASYVVTSPEGEPHVGGGTFSQLCEWDAAGGTCTAELTGSYHFPTADTDWLNEGIESATFAAASWSGDSWTITLDGGAGVLPGDIAFDGLELSPAGARGGFAIRDPGGYWHAVTLGEDGCGTLDWRGEGEGTICPDFSAWLTPLDPLEDLCSSG